MNITNQQKARIHALKKQLCWDDDTYRDALYKWFSVKSCSELSYSGAGQCIQYLDAMLSQATESGEATRGWVSTTDVTDSAQQVRGYGWGKNKYECLGFRKGFATPRELRAINAMWSEVTRQKSPQDKDKALDVYLQNKFSIGNITMIKSDDVARVRKALAGMKSWATRASATPKKSAQTNNQSITEETIQ